LVSWDTISQPYEFGGLGVKDLKLQGLALRARWAWLKRTDASRPWQGLPVLKDDDALAVFQGLAQIQVGDGRRTVFWTDAWIDGWTAADIAPLVAATIPMRRKNSRSVAEALHQNAWMSDIQGTLTEEGSRQCVLLWLRVSTVQRNAGVEDIFRWKGSKSGEYSARDTYNMLCQGRIRSPTAAPIWKSRATLNCKIFSWLAMQYRLWTSDRRARHGLQEQPVPCFICLQEEDNVDHILAQCAYSREVWYRCLQHMGLQIMEPQEDSKLQEWWLFARRQIHPRDKRKFDTLVILTSWMLWKQRNARVFDHRSQQWDPGQLVDRIRDELALWEIAHAGGSAPASRE
jgi:hypothetical protein